MSQVLNVLAQLDTRAYQEYRPSLKGTSGGDSINLRLLTRLCRGFQVDGDKLTVVGDDISRHTEEILLNAVHSLQYSLGLFWSAHLALAVTSNGLDATGTAGTSVREMFVHLESVLDTKFSQWVPRYAATCPPNSHWIDASGKPKEVGEAIFASSNLQEVPVPAPCSLLSQPDKLFDDCWSTTFLSQSMAPPLKTSMLGMDEMGRRHIARLDLEYHYCCVLPEFKETVLRILHLDQQKAAVNTGANLSELMFKIFVGLQQNMSPYGQKIPVVVSASTDFLSFRAAWRMLERWGWLRAEVLVSVDTLEIAQPILDAIQLHEHDVRLVHITAVSSVWQLSYTEKELMDVIAAARRIGAVVVIDVCQAFCNIEYDFGRILQGNLEDVFIVGSCIKHGRSLEGVGWCAYDPKNSFSKELPSGWCADLTMLNFPMHEPEMKDMGTRLEGGTVANAVHTELFIKQQRLMQDMGLSITAVNQRVQTLQAHFLACLGNDANGSTAFGRVIGWRRRLLHPQARSKVLVIECMHGVSSEKLQAKLAELGFRCDSRHGKFLRLGFDLCHTEANVLCLADAISRLSKESFEKKFIQLV
eukprot:CAMPEP_0172927208 /NCGR_PEP_ID=MMETSP1075-20121228/217080_1 /TAXON_ID=2916 /ORGANISM="Ceratium fusus, Strain PA161109" /LENGTH=585 /DNA_ID=CAMNT_0013788427 /DNA_START=472 /DNA_END=2229 /DNA_ORIENTATION=-